MDLYPYFLVAASLTAASIAPAMTTLSAGGGIGGTRPFRNEAPSLGLRYLINVDGGEVDEGEVALYAGRDTNRPTGWLPAEGQLLPITGNETLFDKLQTTFGGDGVNDFALPDLRGRTVIGAGDQPGGSTYALGDTPGSETAILMLDDVPAHTHDLGSGLVTDAGGGSGLHSNLQPSLALTPIIATVGQFPSRSVIAPPDEAPSSAIGSPGSGPLLGQMTWLAHDEVPDGWAVADGTVLSISNNEALFSLLGTQYGGDGRTNFALPDLRGRASTGSSNSVRVGDTFGTATETLTAAQLPNHTHELLGGLGQTAAAGGGLAQDNRQPALALTAIVATVGQFPDQTSSQSDASLSEASVEPADLGGGEFPYLASVDWFAGNFVPRGYARADGSLRSIAQDTALFALMWDTYGGDARSTFALPDLRERLPVGVGEGDGLTERLLGEEFGDATAPLTIGNLPPHVHTYVVPGDYNNDGVVNAADYAVWRDNGNAAAGTLPNDTDGGPIGPAQLATWGDRYGTAIGFPAAGPAVPEPSTFALLAIGGVLSHRRRSQ